MERNGRFTLAMLILLLTGTCSVNAFDGKRTGFCLGIGAGLETITSHEDWVSDHQTRSGFQTTLDIGAGISDRILILFSLHTTINSKVDPPYDKVIWLEPSVILRYYLKPTVRSFYIFGGPALAIGTGFLIWEEVIGASAIGVTVGSGYQFNRQFHVQLGAVLTSGSAASFMSFHVTVNLLGN